MGVRHRRYKLEGVQFHPESVLTQSGKQLLQNFPRLVTHRPFVRITIWKPPPAQVRRVIMWCLPSLIGFPLIFLLSFPIDRAIGWRQVNVAEVFLFWFLLNRSSWYYHCLCEPDSSKKARSFCYTCGGPCMGPLSPSAFWRTCS